MQVRGTKETEVGKFGHNRQREPLERKWQLPEKRTTMLWLMALVWIIFVATLEDDVRIGLYGATIELLAAVVCIQLTWTIKRDHDELSNRIAQTNIPRAQVQCALDETAILRAGWILRDMEQYETDGAGPTGNVYQFNKLRADRLDRQLDTMRRPVAPVPSQRQAEDHESDSA